MESKEGPLREVVWRGQRAFGATAEKLSCGHFQSALRPRPVKRRRCRQCYEAAQRMVQPSKEKKT